VRRSVSILCHTLSGNAFGRAWLLAQLLETDFDVHIIAACRPRDELWLPARGQCSFEIRRWTSFSTPGFVARAAGLARELVTGELIYAVKPRLSSFGLGLVARRVLGRPLVADVDDHELGFSSLARELAGLPWALASAASPVHTRLLSALTSRADAVTVSSSFLHARHGGTWVPHARDEQVFVARHAERAGPPTVMFVGTPRGHKGLDDLLEAFRQVPAPARLRLVGGALDAALVERVAAMREPRVSVEPPVPMRELPAVLEQADVVAIPQKDGAASQGQLPAKLLDAMALGKAIVATRVGDLPQWLGGEAGRVVPPGDPAALGAALRELLSDAALRSALGARARSRFLALGSFAAVRPRLLGVVERVLAGHSRETGLAPFAALS
jgi:glycosyltransferase involved in cell wall biosynthesis